MKDDDVKNRFVELRAKNWSYNRIASELKVSKQTLIAWSKDLSHVIANLRAIELEGLQEKYFGLRENRLKLFSEILRKIESELVKRDLKGVPTDKLFLLFLKYADAVKAESIEPVFAQTESTFLEGLTRVSTWRA